jgi:uncharacterized protein (DUF983 family)
MSYHVETPVDAAAAGAPRNVWNAMWRGARNLCPACGVGAIFHKYLKVSDTCPACATALHHQRADDAPPYFTMLIVGHLVGGGVLALEKAYAPDTWVHIAIWFPLTIGLSLWLLPRIKGALIGLQWAHRMHGFGGAEDRPGDGLSGVAVDDAKTKRAV